MTPEEFEFLRIEDGKYDNHLRQSLFLRKSMLGYETPLISAILKLIRWDLTLNDPAEFFEDSEKEILSSFPEQDVPVNKELLARWMDFSMLWTEPKDAAQVKMAVEAYLDVYSATEERDYFIRALEIGRPMKGMFKDRAAEFYETGCGIIRSDLYPLWQNMILKVLISFCTLDRCRKDFQVFFWDQHLAFLTSECFSEARKTLKCLRTLKVLNAEAYKIKCAEAYLAEGDSWLGKDPASYYIGLADIYLKGVRKLHSVGNCDNLRNLLIKRTEQHQLARNEIVSIGGVKLMPEIDFEKLKISWALKGMTDFNKAFDALLNLPVISAKDIRELVDKEKSEGYYFNKMLDSVSLSARGAKIGFLSGDQAIEHRFRMQLRELHLADIQALKFVMDVDGQRDIESIARMMPESSPFLQEERGRIFFKGLYAGFQHDFQTAAYILMPQFENAFKYLARNNEILLVRYHDKQQFDNTMGGCLEKISSLLNDDTFTELKNFLTDSNQSNFRNELLHGISEPGLVQHFGKYIWWLALKMIFRPQELLA